MMYWNNNHMTAGGWIFAILGTIIVLALLVAGIVWILSELSDRRGGEDAPGASSGEILNRRLASGEITDEQYQQLSDLLEPASSGTLGSRAKRPASAPG